VQDRKALMWKEANRVVNESITLKTVPEATYRKEVPGAVASLVREGKDAAVLVICDLQSAGCSKETLWWPMEI
jgi:hypothetical protein